jgi:predicted nucleic acid-binding protein
VSVAQLDAALAQAQRALLDSSTLIAYHQPAEPAHALARHLMVRIGNDGDPLVGYYSMITAAELLIRPIRTGAAEIAFMHEFLTGSPALRGLVMDFAVAQQAATVRAATGLRLPDAIVVASGLLAGCEAIVTNDEQWRRRLEPLFGQFRWIYLGDYL